MDAKTRKSARLSGIRPELTFDEASEMISSPAREAGRRRRGSGDSVKSETSETAAAAPLPVKKRIMEAIEEESSPNPSTAEGGNSASEEPKIAEDAPNKMLSDGASDKDDVMETEEPETSLARVPPTQDVSEEAKQPETTLVKSPEEMKTVEKAGSAVSTKIERIASTSVPKGKCKSGRFWKSERDRFRSTIKSRGLKQSLQQRVRAKEEKERARQVLQRLKDEQKRAIEEKKARREENLKRREENARKAEVVQIIKNPNKIKRMKKKQLRMIAKRDVLSMNVQK